MNTISKITKNWRLSAFILGAMAGAACAPLQSLILLVIGFSGMLLLHRSLDLSVRDDLKFGLYFSYGYCLTSLYWVAWSFKMVGWSTWPLVIFIFPFVASVFYLPVFALLHHCKKHPLLYALVFAVGWSFFGDLKGLPFPNFPWSFIGYALPDNLQQLGSFVGVEGLSILTLCVVALLATRWAWVGGALLLIGVGAGHLRLQAPDSPEHCVNVRLVQPSIPQDTKWSREHIENNFLKHLALSQLESEKPLDLIIWPEASIPLPLNKFENVRMSLMEAAPEKGHMIVGAPRDEGESVYTSAYVINSRAEIIDVYDKSHLTPFGEYMPFRKYLPFEKLTAGTRDYAEGAGLRSINVEGLPPFAILICYESIFSNHVIPEKNSEKNVEWLLNITNDAWFGNTKGPAQHLQIVRMRAIEEGIAILRVANNGITAVIDSYGRVLKKLPLNAVGFIDTNIPKKIDGATYFSRHRHIAYWIYGVLLLLIAGVYWRQRK